MAAIAFIGATGRLGAPVAHQLVAAGHTLSCLVRDPGKALRLLPPGVRLIEGHLRQPEAVAAALSRQEVLYVSLSVDYSSQEGEWQPEREGLIELLKAARRANIRRVLYLSSLIMEYQGWAGFDWWVFRLKQQAAYVVRECGIPNTIFRPSNFMENFTVGPYRDGRRLLLAGTSHEPMYFIAAADYGRQVARAIDLDVAHQDYIVQGPEAYTADQAAEVFRDNYPHGPLTIAKMPLGLLKFLGNFSRKLHNGSRILEALNNFPEPFSAERTWDRLGRPTTTLAEFARNAPPLVK